MDKLKYEMLTEITGRMRAELLESFLEANGVDVELFQESIGRTIYPVNVDMLGYVQVFVPREKIKLAKKLFKEFNEE